MTLREEMQSWSLALVFASGAAVCASPPSLVGRLVDESIGHYKKTYINCVDDIYGRAWAEGYTDTIGSKALISALIRLSCFTHS
jgi:hypothetical protein